MQKKFSILVLAISILFASVSLVGCWRNNMNTIEYENFSDISLTIYYRDFFSLSRPATLEQLIGGWYDNTGQQINGWYDHRVVVTGQDLLEHRDLINQLFVTELAPTETKSIVDARLYYVFEHKTYGELFSFLGFELETGNVFVNGVEVEHNNIFFEVILPFLSEDIAEQVGRFIKKE